MIEIYEVWGDVETGIGTTISSQAGITEMIILGMMEPGESPLYSIRAASWVEAMTYHYEHNGWTPYRPEGGDP